MSMLAHLMQVANATSASVAELHERMDRVEASLQAVRTPEINQADAPALQNAVEVISATRRQLQHASMQRIEIDKEIQELAVAAIAGVSDAAHESSACLAVSSNLESAAAATAAVPVAVPVEAKTSAAAVAPPSIAEPAAAIIPELAVDGFMVKRAGDSTSAMQRRWFALRDTKIFYFEHEVHGSVLSSNAQRQLLGQIDLSTAFSFAALEKSASAAAVAEGLEFGFSIVCPDRVWELYAESESQRARWLNSLKKLVEPLPPMVVRRQGYMMKQGGIFGSWKKRWCILGDDSLYYFDSAADASNFTQLALGAFEFIPSVLLKPALGFVNLRHGTIAEIGAYDSHAFVFAVTVPEGDKQRTYKFAAIDAADSRRWLEQLERARFEAEATLASAPSAAAELVRAKYARAMVSSFGGANSNSL